MAWIVIWLADGNFVSFRKCTMETPSRRLFPIYNHVYCFIDSDFQLVFVLGSSDSSVRGEPYRIFDIFFGRSASLGKCWSLDDDQSNEWSILICVTLTGPLENGKTILAPYVLITTFSFSFYYCWCLSLTKVLIAECLPAYVNKSDSTCLNGRVGFGSVLKVSPSFSVLHLWELILVE